MATTPLINRLIPSDEIAVAGLLRIYQSSIEPSEQKTAEQVKAIFADPRYRVLVSRNGSDITGFAMVFFPVRAPFVLLEYMAVDESYRSLGIGAALLDAASDVAAEQGTPLLLEVDQPDASLSPGNDTMKRLRFYAERNCLRIDGINYILPLSTNGAPPPMWLLVRGLTKVLSRNELRAWLAALYVEVYGQDEGDPRIDAMISGIADDELILARITRPGDSL